MPDAKLTYKHWLHLCLQPDAKLTYKHWLHLCLQPVAVKHEEIMLLEWVGCGSGPESPAHPGPPTRVLDEEPLWPLLQTSFYRCMFNVIGGSNTAGPQTALQSPSHTSVSVGTLPWP